MRSDRAGVAELLRRGERALLVEGSLRNSRKWFERAYRLAEKAGQGEAMARAALGLGGCWVHEHRSAAAAAQVEARQRGALRCLEPASVLALRLRARLAAESDYRAGSHDAVLEVVDEARRVDDPIAVAEALSIAHHCMLGPAHGADRLALADELLLTGSRSGRSSDALMGQLWRTVDLFLDGNPTAERSLSELRRSLARDDHLAVGFVVSAVEVMLAVRAGRLGLAEELAAGCAKRGSVAGDADSTGWHAAQLLAIRWYQGRAAEMAPTFAKLVESPVLGVVDHATYAGLAIASVAADNRRQATIALARLRGPAFVDLPRSSSWLVAMYGAVETAHLLHDEQASADAYALLRPYARLPMMPSLAIACLGSTHHALGVATLTVGDLDRAVMHFGEAVRANQALGHVPAAVMSTHRLGQALSLRGEAGDSEQGALDLAAAADDAASLGMVLPAESGLPPMRPGTRGRTALPVAQRVGRTWRVRLGTRATTVPDSVGMRHLAVLLDHPGREIAAADLAAASTGSPASAAARSSSKQPLLDNQAMREYRTRLAQVTAELEEYERMNDLTRASQARVERDWLVAELSSATGLNGRARHFADDIERSRIAVTKAIRRALQAVAAADSVIGNSLHARVRTGQYCCFHSD